MRTQKPQLAGRPEVTQPAARPHQEALEAAFLQLSCAIKIWHFMRSGGVQRESIDIALTAVAAAAGVPFVMLEGEFQSDNDVILASENNTSSASLRRDYSLGGNSRALWSLKQNTLTIDIRAR